MSECHNGKKCSGECGKDCPCENPKVLRSLAAFVVSNGRAMTLQEAYAAMECVVCPDCQMNMPRLIAARHSC